MWIFFTFEILLDLAATTTPIAINVVAIITLKLVWDHSSFSTFFFTNLWLLIEVLLIWVTMIACIILQKLFLLTGNTLIFCPSLAPIAIFVAVGTNWWIFLIKMGILSLIANDWEARKIIFGIEEFVFTGEAAAGSRTKTGFATVRTNLAVSGHFTWLGTLAFTLKGIVTWKFILTRSNTRIALWIHK